MDSNPLFTRDGVPLYFALHNSIQKPGVIQALYDQISANGGDLLDSDDGADIVLFNPTRSGLKQSSLQEAYDFHPDEDKRKIWVREMSFVDECVQRGSFELDLSVKKPMPGFPSGKGRTAFTSEDDQNLCQHLARTLPDPAAGGRQSLLFYTKLVSYHKCVQEAYDWTQRHTAQSWREHYKKNKARLDIQIAEIVAEQGVNPKALYHKDRLLNDKTDGDTDEEDEEAANILGDEDEDAYEATLRDKARHSTSKGKARAIESEGQPEAEENQDQNQNAEKVQIAPNSPKIKSRTRSQRQRPRPRVNVPNRGEQDEPEPSRTLVNIDPDLQLADHDGVSIFPAALEGTLDPEDMQPFTLTLEQLMPSAADEQVSVEPPTLEDPPYHNTRSRARSRSASVDPPAPPPPRKTRKAPTPLFLDSQTLPTLREASHEAESPPPENENEHEHTPLFCDSESQAEIQPKFDQELQETTNVFNVRQRGRGDDEESDDDKQIREILEKTAPAEPVVVAIPARGRGRGRPRKRTPSAVPETPARGRGRARKRALSVASESSGSVVPVIGTRASAHKKKRTKEETYNTPFRPLPGTEAARQAERARAQHLDINSYV